MKKFFKALSVCSLAAAMTVGASATAFAAGINAAEQKILDELNTTVTMAGTEKSLPVVYINQAENYLNTVEITDAEADEIIKRIETVKSYLTSTGAAKYDDLTDAQIDEFFALCQDVVSVINLKIAYNKATRVVTIVDSTGAVIFTCQIGNPGYNPGGSEDPGKTDPGKTDPTIDPNPIIKTGFDFNIPGVTAVAGLGILLVSAAGVYFIRTKKKAEDNA